MKIAVIRKNWKVTRHDVDSIQWKDEETITIISNGIVIPIENVLQVVII